MAAGIISYTVKWAAEKLSSLIPASSSSSAAAAAAVAGSSSDPHHSGALEDLRMLERTMRRIQAKLDDAEERNIRDNLEKLHLEELKGVADDAGEVIDEYEYEVQRAKAEARRQSSSSSSSSRKRKLDEEVRDQLDDHLDDFHDQDYLLGHWGDGTEGDESDDYEKEEARRQRSSSSCNCKLDEQVRDQLDDHLDDIHAITVPVPIPNDLAIRVKEIMKRFDEITKDWDALRWREGYGRRWPDYNSWKMQPTTSVVHEPHIHGRDADKENIIQMLLTDNVSSRRRMVVIPIIGMGGIGKTTLAKFIYNDPRVCRYFSRKGWVCVSEDFDILNLMKKIFASITNKKCVHTELNEIMNTLTGKLRGKKFLLVLDDVWNEKPSLWNYLRDLLSSLGYVKVIVTTRNESTAKILQTVPPYRLGCLPFDDCWSIFRQSAFEGREPSAHPELVRVGRKIVVKCKGLPLAVKALGGILRCEVDEEKWTDILESELWDLDEGKNEILPALRLSYERMTPVIKQCFKFFSLFKKDYSFNKNKIVQMWMSQGLLRSEGKKRPEEIGRGYFENLLQLSILQEDPKPCYSENFILQNIRQENFVMHDLIHDLAQYVAGKEYLRLESDVPNNLPKEVRHLSLFLSGPVSNLILRPLQNLKTLRTFILIVGQGNGKDLVDILDNIFQNSKRIMTLVVDGYGISKLPNSISNLKLLRYLDIENTLIEWLPECVLSLYNLQTVLLQYGETFADLGGIEELINLRHLGCPSQTTILPRSLRYLINLQTLPSIYVGRTCRHFRIEDLKNLDYIEALDISNIGYNTSKEKSQEANLKRKEHLKFLRLAGSSGMRDYSMGLMTDRQNSSNKLHEQILENLQPHTNLIGLEIADYGSPKFPSWIGGVSFSKLVSVRLYFCDSTSLPSLGQLPSLRELYIGWFQRLQYIGREFYGVDAAVNSFPSLKFLGFGHMKEWAEWDGGEDGDFPRLQRLSIASCAKLQRLPQHLSPSLSELCLSRCEKLDKLPALPSLTILRLQGSSFNEMILSSSDLPSLRTLEIYRVESRFLKIDCGNLHSLKELRISWCSNLRAVVSLPDLTFLDVLEVRKSPHVEFLLPRPTVKMDSPLLEEYCRSRGIKLIADRGFLESFESFDLSP